MLISYRRKQEYRLENATISSVISYVIYVIILIPVIIAALQALNITAISNPAIACSTQCLVCFLTFLLLLHLVVIGTIVARIAGKLLAQILSGLGTDSILKKMVPSDNSKLKDFSLSKAIGEFVKYVIILLFVVEATNVINLKYSETLEEQLLHIFQWLLVRLLFWALLCLYHHGLEAS